MPAFKVNQIFFDKKSREILDPGFVPLDNTENLRPDWYEFWVIRNYLHTNKLDENAWYGFLSPSFADKTGLSSQDLYGFLNRIDGHADVAILTHGWDQIAYFLNLFEQGEYWHPGLIEIAEIFFKDAGINLDVKSYIAHSQNSVFSNYFVAKPIFWRRWIEIADKLFECAENPSNKLFNRLRGSCSYVSSGRGTEMKVFIQERIAPALLASENFRVIAAELSPQLPVFNVLFNEDVRTRRLLIVCDTMKLEYCSSKDDTYLDVYKKIRSSISTNRHVQLL